MSPDSDGSAEVVAARLRHQLADHLAATGVLTDPRWRAAVESVPRHLFVPHFFDTDNPPDGSPSVHRPISADRVGVDRWLDLAYADRFLITQLDHTLTADDPALGPDASRVNCVATSSSSMPTMVLQMWGALDVTDGDRILEIGTGTGYSTALGAHCLGDDNVTSVEIDPEVAARARNALDAAGSHPHLVVGDGLLGAPDRGPFDRVIATCAVHHIPPAWIAQSRPGGIIVAPVAGWLNASGLVKLTVTNPDAGTAEGRFLTSEISFMPVRAHEPDFVVLPDRDQPLRERPAVIGPELLSDWGPAGFLTQLAAPRAQHLELTSDDPDIVFPPHMLVGSDGSYVEFTGDTNAWMVSQGGPVQLWDAVESAVLAWRAAGEPELSEFRVTVSPEQQIVTFADQVAGLLPL